MKWKMIPALREIIESAEKVSTKKAKGRDDGIVAFHWLEATVNLEGRDFRVGVQIGEDKSGNKFFNLNQDLDEWLAKYKTPQSGRRSSPGTEGAEGGQGPSFTQTIPQPDDGVNIVLFEKDDRDQKRGSIQFNADRSKVIINLFKNADLSTFLHEAGHLFLIELFEDAALPDAPQQLKDDVAEVLRWFGVESVDQVTREHHEQWARAFEAKLRGKDEEKWVKAPSVELQSVFQRFRAWLVHVYKTIKELGVTITPEISAVMDRLLATDEEIALAEQSNRLMFPTCVGVNHVAGCLCQPALFPRGRRVLKYATF